MYIYTTVPRQEDLKQNMMLVKVLAFTVSAYTLGYTQNCRHWQRDLSLEGKNVLAVRLFTASANAINCAGLCSKDKSCVIFSHKDSSDLCLGFSSFATGTNGTNETDVLQSKVFRDGQNRIYTRDFLSNMTVFAYETAKTWRDASNVCSNDGAGLVSLETWEKRKRIIDVTDMKFSHYIGLSDSVVESTWLWESGNIFNLSSETNFNINNYDGSMSDSRSHNADCAVLGTVAQIFDVNCDQEYPFICERD